MPSTFSDSLRLELIADGEQAGLWGQTTNRNLGTLIETSIAGVRSIAMPDANYTLTTVNGLDDDARYAVLALSGSLTTARDLIIPDVTKVYVVQNATNQTVNIGTAAGVKVALPAGLRTTVYCDGVDTLVTNSFVSALTVGGALTAGSITGTPVSATNLSYTGTLTGGTGIVNIGSGQLYKDASGNVGVGTATPTGKFHVVTSANKLVKFVDANNANFSNPASGITLSRSSDGAEIGAVFSFGLTGDLAVVGRESVVIGTGGDGLYSDTSARLTIDSAGNAGLGVVPSAWGGGRTGFQVGNTTSLANDPNGAAIFGLNNYFNGTNFIQTLGAVNPAQIALDTNGVKFNLATSVGAGAPITFTQAMTLTQGGDLEVRSVAGTGTLTLTSNAGAYSSVINMKSSAGGSSAILADQLLQLFTNGVERARITSGGNLLVGTTINTDARVYAAGVADGADAFRAESTGSNGVILIRPDGVNGNQLRFGGNGANANILRFVSGGELERARITSGGYFKASNTGGDQGIAGLASQYNEGVNHAFFSSAPGDYTVVAGHSSLNGFSFGSFLNSGSVGFHYRASTGNAIVYQVLANGNVQNTNNSYGAISDAKLKTVTATNLSYWEKYKLIEWVKYTLKADPTNQEMLGVIAQQVQGIFPGLIESTPDMVDVQKTREVTKIVPVTTTEVQESTRTEIVFENGEYIQKSITESKEVQVPVFDEFDLKNEAGEVIGKHQVPRTETVTETETETYTEKEPNGEVTLSVKYSILGHIADVVLQEAMARIEADAAAIEALKARIEVLESK